VQVGLTVTAVSLDRIDPVTVVGALSTLVLAQLSAALAWRAALAAAGAHVSLRASVRCYGAGSLTNTLLPANAGNAVRIGLFARAVGRDASWLCGGACIGLSLVRAALFCLLLAGCVATGLMPGDMLVWSAAAVVLVASSIVLLRRRGGRRWQAVVLGVRGVSPAVLGWLALVMLLRFTAAALVLSATDAHSPLTAAAAMLAASGLAATVPLTPANVGIANASLTLALVGVGLDARSALVVGVVFHGLETAAGLGFGLFGLAAGADTRRLAARLAPIRRRVLTTRTSS